jgi:hypothetical protein
MTILIIFPSKKRIKKKDTKIQNKISNFHLKSHISPKKEFFYDSHEAIWNILELHSLMHLHPFLNLPDQSLECQVDFYGF